MESSKRDYAPFRILEKLPEKDDKPPEDSTRGMEDVTLTEIGKAALGSNAEVYTTFMANKKPPARRQEDVVAPPQGPVLDQKMFAQSLAPRRNT